MEKQATTIATITRARNSSEEKLILRALSALQAYTVITADGGSRPSFIAALHKLGIQIVCPKEKGLVCQARASLRAALDASDNPLILYTEPDKLPFFQQKLARFLTSAKKQPAFLTCASRDARSFKTFPEGQIRAESFMNDSAALILRQKADYCYGPLLLSRPAAKLALEAPEHLGWGWRFWLLGRTVYKKQQVRTIELPLPCPQEQRRENRPSDQIYRLKQLKQNLEGLFLGQNLEGLFLGAHLE